MLAGDPRQWLAHFTSLEQRLAVAIEAAWPICIAPLQAVKGTMTHEDYITNHLVAGLIRSKTLPGRIVPQYALLAPNAQQLFHVGSKIDFVLTIGDDEDVYLACECKRLNVPYKAKTRALAYEYVRDGLTRFVTGQYANGLPLSMMLGYVMDAQVTLAHDRLKKALKRSKLVNLKSAVHPPPIAGRPVRFITTHQCAAGNDIEVCHTLLGWP
ncbi:MAG: hypothetical protein FD139_819 [Methylocystaceae bacterium]|nr:MAG: hypothetical protein FD148_1035 [Methylocystaceae bacterium]KAF0207495.1 MAG: hypothetical protein FD172_3648 [Methylocystaceae bacterium]TXT46640.1 MAG: hypothetical protein FD139_819 [Methylocystaceae bacterium]